jgi:hypothetical protein
MGANSLFNNLKAHVCVTELVMSEETLEVIENPETP